MQNRPMTVADVALMLKGLPWGASAEKTRPEGSRKPQSGSTGASQDSPSSFANPEAQLETETGHDVVQTGKHPPTFVETRPEAGPPEGARLAPAVPKRTAKGKD